jgi:4'-phosphopantetheinyl transferase
MLGDPLPLPPLPCPGWLRVWPLHAVGLRSAARPVLEQMLVDAAAGRAGVPAGLVTVRRDASGRPVLSGLPPGHTCSLAYTHGLALAALADGPAVGVDGEHPAAKVDWREVAAEVFCAGERAALASGQDEAEARRIFFRLWARKEALAKAVGLGVRALDARTPLGAAAGGAAPLAAWTACGPAAWLLDLPLGGEMAGSVALSAGPAS